MIHPLAGCRTEARSPLAFVSILCSEAVRENRIWTTLADVVFQGDHTTVTMHNTPRHG
jgi:hypothetical protein